MKKVLLVTQGTDHPPVLAQRTLSRLMKIQEKYDIEQIPSPEHFPDDLDRFIAMVLYYHLDKVSDRDLAIFERFVAKGGGILALHSATASFMNSALYFKILGGKFVEHDVITEFLLSPVKGTAIFPDLPEFAVEDELYIHETEPDIQVHITTNLAGEQIPVAWTHRYEKGRIFYASPGHLTETMHNPHYQEVILRGLSWACGG